MKRYLNNIQRVQYFLLAVSVILLATLPTMLVVVPEWFTASVFGWLYFMAHATLFFVMLVRPLSDVFPSIIWLRPLVVLRKGFGVLSAAIIVSFIISKVMIDAQGYFAAMATLEYWSFSTMAFFAHAADIAAVLLLVTSNTLSKRLLKRNWKRIQRLSYVYFYGSGLYVTVMLEETLVLYYMIIVTLFTVLAWLFNHGIIQRTQPQTV